MPSASTSMDGALHVWFGLTETVVLGGGYNLVPLMSLAPGTKLGPYEIVALLGAGGMGEVYRARDTRLGREVAVKVLPASYSTDPERLRRFEQEARAAGALNHPNILAIYDVGTHKDSPYLVSELLDGETLGEQLQGGALPLRKSVDIALQVARGMAAAHEKGVVHRDLKPANIFLTVDGRVKVLDFGLAKLAQRDDTGIDKAESLTQASGTESGVVLGTVGYMSPEQVRGKPADARSDIFALGTILYEMLSGHRAFRKDSSADTMAAILKEDPPQLSSNNRSVPPGVERVVGHCLEKNPAERFQSARDLAFDLEALSGLSGASSERPYSSQSRWQKWLVRLGVALGLLAVGVAADKILGKRGNWSLPPTFQQLTFRRGLLYSARFAPDGKTVVYSASWDGEAPRLYSTQPNSPESRSLDVTNSILFAVSSSNELAISSGCNYLFGGECYGTLARMPLSGGSPREVLDNVNSADWSPDGAELAVARQIGGKFRVEFPVGKVLYENADGWLSSIRVSPDGNEVAFAEHPERGEDEGSVVVLDRNGGIKTRSESRWSIQGLSWSPRADEVWYGAAHEQSFANEVHAMSLSGKDRVILRLPGILRLHDISREGHLLISKDAWRGAMLFRGPEDPRERDLSWLDYPIISDLSSDGARVAFAEEGEAAGTSFLIYMRKVNGAPAVKIGKGERPAFSPDQKWVVAGSPPAGRLTLMPTGVGEATDLNPHTIRRITSPSWTPDGKQIVFAGNDGSGWRIYAQDLFGGSPRPITPVVLVEPEKFESSLVSPYGKYVYARDLDGKLWVYPSFGGAPRAIPGMTGDETWLNWSNDGSSAYIFAWGKIPARVVRVDLLTGRKQPVTEFAPIDPVGLTGFVTARITPDGKSYAYTYERVLSELYLVDGVK
jgi:serine/threonine protein kinase